MAVTKREADGADHPASHYLVVEDPEKPTTWHLRYKDTNGKPDARLMGACYAALTSNYRGRPYGGPNKQEALSKLRGVYKAAGMTWPGESKSEEPAMEYKSLPFSMESSDADLEENCFKGYVAVFGNVDTHGDVIMPGAFAETLPSFLSDGAICWEHKWDEPIGRPLEAKEDSRGLFIKAKVSDTQRGRDALTLMRDGVLKTLSIGYKTAQSHSLTDNEGHALLGPDAYAQAMETLPWTKAAIRSIDKARLYEGSLVMVPSNKDAKITSVKAGLPAGLMLDEQVEYTLAVNDDLIERYGNVRELRMKAGRMLSSANHAKLRDVHDRLMAQLQALDDLLDSMLPADAGEQDGKAAEQAAELKSLAITEMARFQRTLARMNGAA